MIHLRLLSIVFFFLSIFLQILHTIATSFSRSILNKQKGKKFTNGKLLFYCIVFSDYFYWQDDLTHQYLSEKKMPKDQLFKYSSKRQILSLYFKAVKKYIQKINLKKKEVHLPP